jgi:hypothetical protein
MRTLRNAYGILVEKPEGKRPLETYRLRWKDNIKMDFGEVGWESGDWIHLYRDRFQWRTLVNTAVNLQIP